MSQGMRPILCLCLLSFFYHDPAYADIAQGRVWLAAQAHADGAYAAADDLATPFQTTAEALRTLAALDKSNSAGQDAGLAFLNRQTFANTEYLARRIIARSEAAQSTAALSDELLAHRNPDGGFGDLSDYASSVRDTAWALIALASAGRSGEPAAQAAVDYMLDRQSPAGAWFEGSNPLSVELTALALRALWHSRQTAAVGSAITQARSFLLAARGADGAWGEDFVTALVLLAVLPTLETSATPAATLATLAAGQSADGSWHGDVYTTALALRALALPSGSTISGTVVDAASGAPLLGARIEARHGANGADTLSDAQGRFVISGIAPGEVHLTVTLDTYHSSSLSLTLEPLSIRDIGQIRLRPESLGEAAADLVVQSIDRTAVMDNPHTLALSGTLVVSIANEGSHGAAGFRILVFADRNGDGDYTSGIDPVVGEATSADTLLPAGADSVAIALGGVLDYLDAPLGVWVDWQDEVVEIDETNNVATTAAFCRLTPPPLNETEFRLAWQWSGLADFPDRVHVVAPVLVGQLSDDNGDGLIDDSDIPDVVFAAGNRAAGASESVLVTLSGDDGRLLWARPDLRVSNRSPGALGDIDGDGMLELLVLDIYRNRLMALENDGSLKWTTPTLYGGIGAGADALLLVDLEGDGFVEIVHGRDVYDHTGALLWSGAFDRAAGGIAANWGWVPIAADIDADGRSEIIAGRSVYAADGEVVWHRADLPDDGYNAIGDFDTDAYPEILLVSHGKIYLLQHTGETIWGPVTLPGGGRGGPPTVADFDNDGAPEIGVSAARAYTVFEADGSVKWSNRVSDVSSSATGSSVFDFEEDGKAEVLYADERHFRIYDGANGTTRVEIANGSTTAIEYPVIADIDSDGSAEVLLPANFQGDFRGLRVFESASRSWPGARGLWNQHSYHITNIDDDGTIPATEAPSWIEHNTYRLNTLLGRDPLNQADLSIARPVLIDHGSGQALDLTVRIGNAGPLTPLLPTVVAFYQGDPDDNGLLLGQIEVPSLAAGTYQDITFSGLTPSGAEIYALIDPADTVSECDETNNRVLLSEITAAPLGALEVATDAPIYGPNDTAVLLLTVSNRGALAADYRIGARIEDGSGNTVTTFPGQAVNALAGGAERTVSLTWNTAATLAGDYRVLGALLDRDGLPLDAAAAAFSIRSANGATPAAAVRITTDKPIYHTRDTVHIDALLHNLSSNVLLSAAVLQVTIANGTNQPVFEQTINHIELAPGNTREITLQFPFSGLLEGSYMVHGILLDRNGKLLASTQTPLGIVDQIALALAAEVDVAARTLVAGARQTCTGSLVYQGTQTSIEQPVRLLWVHQNTGESIASHAAQVDLHPGQTVNIAQAIATAGFAAGEYACILQAQLAADWLTLDYASFTLESTAGGPGDPDESGDPGDSGDSDIADEGDTGEEPVTPITPVAVPALPAWSVAVLIALLALCGGMQLRRTNWATSPAEPRRGTGRW